MPSASRSRLLFSCAPTRSSNEAAGVSLRLQPPRLPRRGASGRSRPMPVAGFLSGRSRAETGDLLADFHRGLRWRRASADGERVRILNTAALRTPTLRAASGARRPSSVERRVAVICDRPADMSAALAAKAATPSIPIVCARRLAIRSAPRLGFASSLSRPGGNFTGVSLFIDADSAQRWLEFLRAVLPNLSRIAILGSRAPGTLQLDRGSPPTSPICAAVRGRGAVAGRRAPRARTTSRLAFGDDGLARIEGAVLLSLTTRSSVDARAPPRQHWRPSARLPAI